MVLDSRRGFRGAGEEETNGHGTETINRERLLLPQSKRDKLVRSVIITKPEDNTDIIPINPTNSTL